MLAGRIVKWDALRLQVASHASYSTAGNMGSPFIRHTGTLQSGYCEDYQTISPGIFLLVESVFKYDEIAQVPYHSSKWQASIPALGVSYSDSDSGFSGSLSVRVDLVDFALYMLDSGTWYVTVGQIKVYKNDSLVATYGGGAIGSGVVPFPCAVPLMGVPPLLVSGCGADRYQLNEINYEPWFYDAEIHASAIGGWDFLVDGEWVSLPVKTPPVTLAPNKGWPYDLGPGDVPSAAGTAGASCGSMNIHNARSKGAPSSGGRYGLDYQDVESSQSSVMLAPDSPKGLIRLCDDYAALVYRGKFPGVRSYSGRGGTKAIITPGVPTPPSTITTNMYAGMSEYLAVAGDAKGPLEEALDKHTYAPVSLSHAKLHALQDPPGFPYSPTKYEIVSYQFPSSVDGSLESPASLSYLTHYEPIVRYLNTWSNPFWSYFLWFPPEAVPDSVRWKQGGVPYTPQEFWLSARQQQLYHPALPSGGPKTRASVVTEPLSQNGLAGLMDGIVAGQVTSWWGIPRFEAIEPTYPALWEYTNQASYTVDEDDGTKLGFFFTPAAPGPFAVNLDLASHSRTPFMAGEVASDIHWKAPVGADGAELWLVAADGTEVKLGPADESYYPFPRKSPGAKYAGSWAQDFSCGGPSDEGEDKKTGGDSPAALGSNERSVSLQLGQNRAWKTLSMRWDAEDTDAVHMTVAKAHPPTGTARAVTTVPREAAVLWANARGVRVGHLGYWNYPLDSFASPPLVESPCMAMTALDALCIRRALFEGKDPEDGLDAEIEGLYDKNIEYTVRAHLARDPYGGVVTTAFVYTPKGTMASLEGTGGKPIFCHVNSYRQAPPLALCPTKKRNERLQETGFYGQYTYSLISDVHRTAVGGSVPLQLRTPGESGTALLGEPDNGRVPGGWKGWKWRLTDSRDLGDDHGLWLGDERIATASPHRGYFAAVDSQVKPGKGLHQTWDPRTGFRYVVVVDDEGIDLVRFRVGSGDSMFRPVEAEGIEGAQIASRGDGSLGLAWSDGSTIRLRDSSSQGEKWGEDMTIGEGKWPAYAIDRKTGAEFCAGWLGSGPEDTADWTLYRRLSSSEDWEDLGTIATGPLSSAGLEIGGEGGNLLVFAYYDDGLKRRTSASFGGQWEDM